MVLRFFSISMFVLFLFPGCSLLEDLLIEDTTPTKTRMEGVWEVIAAYNEKDFSIIDSIQFPRIVFDLQSDNTVISSAGPMMMYVVYGGSKYVNIASKIDEVFNYAKLSFTNGEFFIGGGVVNRFTLEMKLEGLPGQEALTSLLKMLGIGNDYLDVVIYHKFIDVSVEFAPTSNDTMEWCFDNVTTAVYNKKDTQGNYVLWYGWPVDVFSHCRFVMVKRIKTIEQIIDEGARKPE